jgi:hypothetical protein
MKPLEAAMSPGLLTAFVGATAILMLIPGPNVAPARRT